MLLLPELQAVLDRIKPEPREENRARRKAKAIIDVKRIRNSCYTFDTVLQEPNGLRCP